MVYDESGYSCTRELNEVIAVLRSGLGLNADTGKGIGEQFKKPLEYVKGKYFETLSHLVKDYKLRYINEQLLHAILDSNLNDIVIHHQRGDGATTSAIAATKAIDGVLFVVRFERLAQMYKKEYGIENVISIDSLRGYDLRNINVLIMDDRLEFPSDIPVRANFRVIRVYGHDYDFNVICR